MCANNLKQNYFQFKADFFPITVLKITQSDIDKIEQQLLNKIQSAPNYFQQAPMIIDINEINQDIDAVNLKAICDLLREQTIIPVGIRGLQNKQYHLAKAQNLAIINDNKTIKTDLKPQSTISNKQKSAATNKIITKPVRSGTRVYAKGGDLIILAAVNAGGECIADGNIHIYGTLRGRALAGANGNESARIFCQKLDADLVSIAGHYLTNDEFNVPKTSHSMIQIYLNEGTFTIDPI